MYAITLQFIPQLIFDHELLEYLTSLLITVQYINIETLFSFSYLSYIFMVTQYLVDDASLMVKPPYPSEIYRDEFCIVQRMIYIYLSYYVVGDSIC